MNKTSFYSSALFVFLLILPAALKAAPLLDLKGAEGTILLGEYADILEDPAGKLTIEDVSSARFSETLELTEGKTTADILGRLHKTDRVTFFMAAEAIVISLAVIYMK